MGKRKDWRGRKKGVVDAVQCSAVQGGKRVLVEALTITVKRLRAGNGIAEDEAAAGNRWLIDLPGVFAGTTLILQGKRKAR